MKYEYNLKKRGKINILLYEDIETERERVGWGGEGV